MSMESLSGAIFSLAISHLYPWVIRFEAFRAAVVEGVNLLQFIVYQVRLRFYVIKHIFLPEKNYVFSKIICKFEA